MNNQNLINFNFRQLKTILSLYFFTLGTCLLGLSVYLFLESTNFLEQSITTWSGQSLFWSLLIFFAALFLLFLPIEFFKSHVIKCFEKEEKIFESSGTTGKKSYHYINDLNILINKFILEKFTFFNI